MINRLQKNQNQKLIACDRQILFNFLQYVFFIRFEYYLTSLLPQILMLGSVQKEIKKQFVFVFWWLNISYTIVNFIVTLPFEGLFYMFGFAQILKFFLFDILVVTMFYMSDINRLFKENSVINLKLNRKQRITLCHIYRLLFTMVNKIILEAIHLN